MSTTGQFSKLRNSEFCDRRQLECRRTERQMTMRKSSWLGQDHRGYVSLEDVNSISIGSNDDLEINGIIFHVANGMSDAINGTINVNNGGTLALKGAGVANSGDINLNSTGSATEIEISGLNDTESDTTITGGGAALSAR